METIRDVFFGIILIVLFALFVGKSTQLKQTFWVFYESATDSCAPEVVSAYDMQEAQRELLGDERMLSDLELKYDSLSHSDKITKEGKKLLDKIQLMKRSVELGQASVEGIEHKFEEGIEYFKRRNLSDVSELIEIWSK